MGRYIFRLPDIGEGIAEAEIVAWHVKVGDVVEEDGRLADMMTDKATVEMESPVSGKVIEVAGEAGDVIPIGSPLVVIEVEGDGSDAGDSCSPVEEPSKTAQSPAMRSEHGLAPEGDRKAVSADEIVPASFGSVEANSPSEIGMAPKAPAPVSPEFLTRVMASPAVRQRAAALNIDLSEVRSTADGRVRHADLDAFVAYNASRGFQSIGRKRADEQVRVIGLRRRIAENMAASKRHIPHFSYVEEYDVTALEEVRTQLNASRGDRPKLTMLPFLITAICRLVPDFPMLNAHYDDQAGMVTRYGSVHLGLAAQTPGGLMVPIIRDAQDLNLWQLATEIGRLANAARDGSAKPSELSGSTITVTSLGPMGGVATTPVINRPEVAIIGPNRLFERPVFVKDALGNERVEKRKLMNISMSCDHRVVDGWDAASFAQNLKKLIETPVLLVGQA